MDPNEAGVPTPSIGRIVIYRDEERDVAAIVTDVLDAGAVSLTVFSPGAVPQPVHDVPLNDPASGQVAPSTWRWPILR